ncbi:MAG: 5'/3'-nucleotidase SurE [Gemmatimonadales bacterium]|jgi:5'-nucleotidase|nr:MAG: 5'/3'-nucleotidase SurE [Gemmatimonadales bacterium]
MRILCTNDDGYLATGLNVLASAARPLGEVSIVAPDREQSATSHSLTIHHPLRARRARDGALVVDGTPTDCVILAVGELLDQRPDIVLSGVNHGPNMGEDVLYSGTVAAAMEATVLGIPAVAVSYTGSEYEELPGWEGILTGLLRAMVRAKDFPTDTLFSVNLPPVSPDEVRGVRVTSLGKRRYSDSLTRALDPSGKEYFWIGGGVTNWSGASDSDFRAVEEGYISVTPLHLDLTNYGLLEEIRGWELSL